MKVEIYGFGFKKIRSKFCLGVDWRPSPKGRLWPDYRYSFAVGLGFWIIHFCYGKVK